MLVSSGWEVGSKDEEGVHIEFRNKIHWTTNIQGRPSLGAGLYTGEGLLIY